MKNPKLILLLIILLSFVIFYPSLFSFYTNDDFFLLKISNAKTITDFFNFFNLKQGPEGLGMYRPLAMQSFFMLAWRLFNLNPLGLHVISYLFFFGIIYLVFILIKKLVDNEKIALFASFLYATSSTHFAHLYWLSDFQELAMTFFFLSGIWFFIKFINTQRLIHYFVLLIAFLLSLLSKETAIVFPFVLGLIYIYFKFTNKSKIPVKKFILSLTPIVLLLVGYFYFRFTYYGFPKGVSYIWDFSPRFINTLFWYVLWAVNIPEMLVDFVGPGLRINLNPLLFWKNYLIVIFTSIFILLTILVVNLGEFIRKSKKVDYILFFLGVIWFITTLLPVLFLPWHKFSYYLTLPLIGIIIPISYLIYKSKNFKFYAIIFSTIWLLLSITNTKLSIRSSWITKGEDTAKNVYTYFKNNEILLNGKNIAFYDTSEDNVYAPWYPSETLRTVLSDNNFIYVFFPEIKSVVYLREKPHNNNQTVDLPARKFVEY